MRCVFLSFTLNEMFLNVNTFPVSNLRTEEDEKYMFLVNKRLGFQVLLFCHLNLI